MNAITPPERLSYSVREFCRASGISVSLFYLLLRRGEGPELMKVGGRTLIALRDAEEWQERMKARARESRVSPFPVVTPSVGRALK